MMTTTMQPTKSSMTTITQAFAGVPLAAQATLDSPIGPLTALATSKGLAGLWFDALENAPGRPKLSRAPSGGWPGEAGLGGRQKHHPGDLDAPLDAKNSHIVAMQRWLDAYWSKQNPSPRDVTLDLHGTPFQRAVWQALLGIPLGRTKTYGEIASQVAKFGFGAVPRATGTAVGRNPVSILVPCHRVIGANGSLTGYAGGLPRKEKLLEHEGVLLT
jgi:methylated-DNA-[protein]-cysteine S-methyltransferase